MKNLPADARRAVGLLYIAAAVIILVELAEAAVLSFPPHTAVASWRYGLLGVLVSKTATFALADALLLAAALVLGHRRVLRALAFLHLFVGIVLVPLSVLYVLDVLALRRAVRPQFVRGFDLNSLRTLAVFLLGCFACFIAFWRIGKARIAAEESREGKVVLITDTPAVER